MRLTALLFLHILTGCAGSGGGLTTASLPAPQGAPAKVETAAPAPIATATPSFVPRGLEARVWQTEARAQPSGLKAGATLQRVAVPLTGSSAPKAAERAALVRAAEVTQSLGATHFLVVRGADEESGLSLPFIAPPAAEFVLYFRVLQAEAGVSLPAGAASAEEILTFMAKGTAKG